MQSACPIGAAGEDVLMEMAPSVSAVRDFWRVMSSGGLPAPSPGRPGPRIRPFSSIKEVRLRKVERLRRDGGLSVEGLLRPRHSAMTRTSSHCSVTSSAGSLAYSLEAFETFDSFDQGPPQLQWQASFQDLDEHLLAKILHLAASPLRAGVGGAAVVVRQWTAYASVCKSWHDVMRREAVAVHCGLDRWPAVRAWLSRACVPLVSLQVTAADGRASQQLSQLVCSPHFQQASGRTLTKVQMGFGFRYTAAADAWPALTSLGDLIGHSRHLLPTTLCSLVLWAKPPIGRPSEAPPNLGPALRHLTHLRSLWLGRWRFCLEDLPPNLQLLKLQDCVTNQPTATWPPPLVPIESPGVAPRGNTPRDPFLPLGTAATSFQNQNHMLLADPNCDWRLLSAFLRPPLRMLE